MFPSKFQPCQGQQEAGASRDAWSGEVFAATRSVCRERSQHGWTGCLVSVICHSAWPPLPLCPEGTAYSLRQLIGFSGKPSPKSSRVTQNSTPP